jgi:hypothetical protein
MYVFPCFILDTHLLTRYLVAGTVNLLIPPSSTLIFLQVTMPPVPSSRTSIFQVQMFLPEKQNSSIVGRPRHQGVMVGMGQKDSYVGYV